MLLYRQADESGNQADERRNVILLGQLQNNIIDYQSQQDIAKK